VAWALEAVDPSGADALKLLEQAALEARALYPELFAADTPMPGNPPAAPRTIYLVAYDGAAGPAGCAALRPIDDDTAEVRRVYVLPTLRGSGVARALMARLESEAVAFGYHAMKLETGNRQQPAMRLYEAIGYTRIPAFGAYVGDPTSVCFGKQLNRTGPA